MSTLRPRFRFRRGGVSSAGASAKVEWSRAGRGRGDAMFDTIRDFIRALAVGERDFGADDHRLAAAALMSHVASADGIVTPAERDRLRRALASAFDLDEEATRRLAEAGARDDLETGEFDGFAARLRRTLDANGRLRIVEMLWEIAFADGAPGEFEADFIARVAEILDVPEPDVVAARRVAGGLGGKAE